MRTFSTRPPAEGQPADLEDRLVDGLEALEQRITQRLHFRRGDWALNSDLGTDGLLGHHISASLAIAVITDAILDEGADEVTGVHDAKATIDPATRSLRYTARIATVYGDVDVSETVS